MKITTSHNTSARVFLVSLLLLAIGCFDLGDRRHPSLVENENGEDVKTDVKESPSDGTSDTPESSPDGGSDEAPPEVVIEMKNQKFVPSETTVKPGTKVIWKTLDESEFHIVKDELPDSSESVDWKGPVQRAGDTWGRVFNEPGEHWYHCENHSNTMIGKLIVEE
jgi:plastocyanin